MSTMMKMMLCVAMAALPNAISALPNALNQSAAVPYGNPAAGCAAGELAGKVAVRPLLPLSLRLPEDATVLCLATLLRGFCLPD